MAHKKPKPDVQRAEKKMEDELKEARQPLESRDIPSKRPDPRPDRKDPGNVILEPGVAGLSDRGVAGGVGLPERATEAELDMERGGNHSLKAIPSDLRNVGDPNTPDVGLAGGLGAGGEMGAGGRGHDPQEGDKWGSDIQPTLERRAPIEKDIREEPRAAPGNLTGAGDLANAAARKDRLMEDKEERRKAGLRRSRKQRG